MKILSFFYGPTLDLETSSDKLLLMRLSLGLVEQRATPCISTQPAGDKEAAI